MAFPNLLDEFKTIDPNAKPAPGGSGAASPPNSGPQRPFGAKIPAWLKSSARFLGKGSVWGTLGAQGLGAASAVADTSAMAATPENRPERAQKILAGLDVLTPAAKSLFYALSGTADPSEPNPMLGPAGQQFVARGSTGGAVPAAAPAPVAPAQVADREVTPPFEGLGAIQSPRPGVVTGERGSFNVIPSAAFTGLDLASSRALSAARQAAADRGDFDAVRASFQAGGGTFQGTTAKQDAQQATMARAFGAIGKAKTIAQQKNAIETYQTLLTAETARETAREAAGAKQTEAERKAANDASAAAKNTAEATVLTQRADAVSAAARSGKYTPDQLATIAAGRALSRESFTVPEGGVPIKPGDPITRLNKSTGAIELVTPKPPKITEANIAASMKARGLTRERAIAAYKAAGHDVSGLK